MQHNLFKTKHADFILACNDVCSEQNSQFQLLNHPVPNNKKLQEHERYDKMLNILTLNNFNLSEIRQNGTIMKTLYFSKVLL